MTPNAISKNTTTWKCHWPTPKPVLDTCGERGLAFTMLVLRIIPAKLRITVDLPWSSVDIKLFLSPSRIETILDRPRLYRPIIE